MNDTKTLRREAAVDGWDLLTGVTGRIPRFTRSDDGLRELFRIGDHFDERVCGGGLDWRDDLLIALIFTLWVAMGVYIAVRLHAAHFFPFN